MASVRLTADLGRKTAPRRAARAQRAAAGARLGLLLLLPDRVREAVRHEHDDHGDQADGDPQPPIGCGNGETDSARDPYRCGCLDALHIKATLEDDRAAKKSDIREKS